jgi:hypothetical protein
MRTGFDEEESRLCFLTLGVAVFIAAASPGAEASEASSGLETLLNDLNRQTYSRLANFADWLDIYMAGERYTESPNNSRVFIQGEVTDRERQSAFGVFNIGGQLRLPNFEERWRLRFDNRFESRERGQAPRYARTEALARANDTFGAGLFLARSFRWLEVDFKPRLLLRDRPGFLNAVEFFSRANVGRFHLEPEVEFFADPDLGTGFAPSFNVSLELSPNFTVRQTNDARYLDRDHRLEGTHTLGLLHSWSEQRGVHYTYHTSFDRRDGSYRMTQYGLGASFYTPIYKKILDLTVTPHVLYLREFQFSNIWGVTLSAIFRIER